MNPNDDNNLWGFLLMGIFLAASWVVIALAMLAIIDKVKG